VCVKTKNLKKKKGKEYNSNITKDYNKENVQRIINKH